MAGPVRDTSVFSLLLALLLLHLSGRAVLCLGQVTPSAVLQQHRTPSLPRRVSNSYPSHPLSFPSSSSSSNSRSMEERESPHNMEEGESPHNIEEGEGPHNIEEGEGPHGMEEREGTHNIEEGGGPHNMEEGEGPHSMDHDVRGNNHLILYGVEVPVYKFRGEDAELKCRYDRGTDPLYSVKWYKDDREFYRYLFKMQSPKTTFSTPGVYVDVQRSNERKVLLKKLTFNSTGVYKCEVSADSPHFHTYENQSVMVVVELPERGPTIHGSRTHYRVGDTARLNCTSSRSKPAAQLTWFINGISTTLG
ncbi:hypothetical protein OTU49_003641 [Cherax quadricarinatus]|uniref:Ig-like domain-containing protein n=1 Tax=Cherax quadricarinatus TaxID=27406 RepID=A0AAW0X8M6_CHEQU